MLKREFTEGGDVKANQRLYQRLCRAIDAPEPNDADAPRLTLDGFALVGGIAVGTKPPGP